jgi:serine phosphatase RsbU (regulator of sigma subunit)
MFWRSKKDRDGKSPSPQPAAGPVPATPVGAASAAIGMSTARFLTGDKDTDRRTVEVLLEMFARLSEARDFDETLVQIVDNSVELCGAERGFLVLLEPSGELRIRVARTRDKKPVQDKERFSTSVVRNVIERNEPKLATVQNESEARDLGQSVFDLRLRAVMCVPLSRTRDDGVSLKGALYVDSKAATREFSQRDLELFNAHSQQAAITLDKHRSHQESLEKARLEHSLELAKAVQSGLMPRTPKDIPGLDIHGFFRAAEKTSGDFFDFVKLKDGRLAVVVGDVSGHGVGPALITQSAQGVLRTGLRMSSDPAAAVTMLNEDLSDRIEPGTFLTLLMLAISADGRVEMCNAGHHGPLLVRDGKVLTYDAHGLALGFAADVEYTIDERFELRTGDVLLAFTDGLIEAHPEEDRDKLLGEERVKELLIEQAARGADAETITRVLAEAAVHFSGGKPEDDVTLVVVRRT